MRLAAPVAVAALAIAGPVADGAAAPPAKYTVAAGHPDLIGGGNTGDSGLVTDHFLHHPTDVLPTGDGGFLVISRTNHRIFQVQPNGTFVTAAGKPPLNFKFGGFSGDGGPATNAELSHPTGLAALPDGGFAFTDSHNYRVRRVDPDGIITTIIGTGSNDGLGTTAGTLNLGFSAGLAALPDGSLVIADTENQKIWKATPGPDGWDPNDPVVQVPGVRGYRVGADGSGGFYVANSFDNLVQHVDAGGDVTTIAGNGGLPPEAELNGEDADQVGIGDPFGITATPDGGVMFWAWDDSKTWGGQLLRVLPDGTIRTILRGDGAGDATGYPRRTIVHALARVPSGVLVADTVYNAVFLLHKTFLQSGPPALPGPPHGTNASPSFTFSSPDPDATFECQLDDGAWLGCTAPTHAYSNVADGQHTFRVRATDSGASTDPSPETWTWTSDASPPEPIALEAPANGATTGSQPTLSWRPTTDAVSSVESYEVHLDGSEVAEIEPSACGATCSWTTARLADGAHRWHVVAEDTPGNRRTSDEPSFVVGANPAASFTVSPEVALTGTTVTFDGSASSVDNGPIATYEWDLDGNGSYETSTGSSALATRSYDQVGKLRPALRVSTAAGATDQTDRALEIRRAPPPGPVGVSINDGAPFTNDPDVQVRLAWPAFSVDATLSNDGGFAAAGVFPVAELVPWTLDARGPERVPRTVYVRFDDSTQTFQDDIVLDRTSPAVTASQLSRRKRSTAKVRRSAVKSAGYVLTVRASDGVSGVAHMQITRNKRVPGSWRRYRTRTSVKSSSSVLVRVRDAAGNTSRWRRASLR